MKIYTLIGVVVATLLLIGVGAYLLLRPTASLTTTEPTPNFGTGDTQTDTTLGQSGSDGTNGQNQPQLVVFSSTKVFKIMDGPIAGAALLQTGRPTTTVARYVMADRGHIFDLTLDSPGSIAKAISNTTIPGVARTTWAAGASAAFVQYADQGTVKTVYVGFPSATSTATSTRALPVRLQFLPNNILDLAVAPAGGSVAYALRTDAGADGYVAAIDGSGARRLFTLPLSQLVLSWPAPGTLLAASPAAAGEPGILFSLDSRTGSASTLLYAPGLTATADRAFSHLVYRTTPGDESQDTYIRNLKSGQSTPVSFDSIPSRCVWSVANPGVLFCPTPLSYVEPLYWTGWLQGAASMADSIVAYDMISAKVTIIATPGTDGGESSDIAELAVSPDDSYLLFIRKGDRSLWGVRLR